MSDQIRTPWTRLGSREKMILDAGWAHVQSVPYKVSMRWLFYRLLQDGFYKDKKADYKNNFLKLFSRARHTNQDGWRQDTVVDDRRSIITRAHHMGCETKDQAVARMRDNVLAAASVPMNHFFRQDYYVEVWYEADAMTHQFEYYTREVDLVPMAGTASIHYKWQLAKRLEDATGLYGKPIRILYFGDEDPSGHIIIQSIEKDVRRWSEATFELIWCGLTMDQVELYRIPKSIAGKGYQWEALPDEEAGAIITSALEEYLDPDIITEADEEAAAFAEEWRGKLERAIDELGSA